MNHTNTPIDWTLAVTRNRDDLLRLLAVVFLTLGIAGGVAVARLPRHVHLSLLRVLRPAEAIARRLIAIAAREISVTPRTAGPAPSSAIPRGKKEREPVFALFDPRRQIGPIKKRVAGHGPNIRHFDGFDAPVPEWQEASPDDMVDVARLIARAKALRAALDDIPAQARRLARMMAKREAAGRPPIRPMRPGRPPGYRERWTHPVDELLSDCQELALMALAPDTS